MDNVSIFWMQILSSVFVFGTIAVLYVWPLLTNRSRNAALIPLLFVHAFRYLGMTLLVSNMVDPTLPKEFLAKAAYGDLIAAGLAVASVYALRSNWRFALTMVWVMNTWGFLDLLVGLRGLVESKIPTFNLEVFWYIYIFYAPLVLISHVMIFWVLFKYKSWKK